MERIVAISSTLNQSSGVTRGKVERMNVLAAARTGSGCDIGDLLMTSNVVTRALLCDSTSTLEDLSNRLFLHGVVELDRGEVMAILDGDTVPTRQAHTGRQA
jgi:hypothetical protein